MLSEEQIKEIREHLEKAQNPLFFFDNDVDGLASFLLLARHIGRGKGVAIKSFPDLNQSYVRKIDELNPDYVFVLDKPMISPEFLKEVQEKNLPLIWIDHHDVPVDLAGFDNVSYYNPLQPLQKFDKEKVKPTSEPTTYLCYKIADKKRDEWIAFIGCIADGFLPEFFPDMIKKYPDFLQECKSAFNCIYGSKIGKIARMLSFGLKDRTTNVVKMLKFLLEVKNPVDILEENSKTYTIHTRFNQIDEKYQVLLEKAKKEQGRGVIYFQYGGDLSISADLANELCYLYPDKIIVVAYIQGAKANISLRGKGVRNLTLKAIEGFEGATGGGHEQATGAKVNVEDLPKFKKKIEELMDKI